MMCAAALLFALALAAALSSAFTTTYSAHVLEKMQINLNTVILSFMIRGREEGMGIEYGIMRTIFKEHKPRQ